MVECANTGNSRGVCQRLEQTGKSDHYGPWHSLDSAPPHGAILCICRGEKRDCVALGLLTSLPHLLRVTGARVQTMTGHRGPVRSVAISEDASIVVSGSQDETIGIWEVATGILCGPGPRGRAATAVHCGTPA